MAKVKRRKLGLKINFELTDSARCRRMIKEPNDQFQHLIRFFTMRDMTAGGQNVLLGWATGLLANEFREAL